MWEAMIEIAMLPGDTMWVYNKMKKNVIWIETKRKKVWIVIQWVRKKETNWVKQGTNHQGSQGGTSCEVPYLHLFHEL
jgi:hypothetical protein